MTRTLPVAVATAIALTAGGCHRISHALVDEDNPETVFLSSSEQGGVATHFEETVPVYTSLWGLIAWNNPVPAEVLGKYYNTGKIQNLTIHHSQTFVEGLITLVAGGGFLVGVRHVRYEGDVIRRIGG